MERFVPMAATPQVGGLSSTLGSMNKAVNGHTIKEELSSLVFSSPSSSFEDEFFRHRPCRLRLLRRESFWTADCDFGKGFLLKELLIGFFWSGAARGRTCLLLVVEGAPFGVGAPVSESDAPFCESVDNSVIA